MNILCTGGALPREENLRKEDKSAKEKKETKRETGACVNAICFSSVTVAIDEKKRKNDPAEGGRGQEEGVDGEVGKGILREVAPILLLCRKIADHGIDRHNIAIITLKSIRRS